MNQDLSPETNPAAPENTTDSPLSETQFPETQMTSEQPKEKPHFFFSKKVLITAFIIILFLILSTSALACAIAYEKIGFVKRFPKFQNFISVVVQEIPFMPKTPKYLLAKTVKIHEDVTKSSFDMSVAMDSGAYAGIIGTGSIDIKAVGALDYTSTENIQGYVNLSVTKDFNADLVKKDKMIYFKINKVPVLILPFLGIDQEKVSPIINQWVSYDTTPLDSEARNLLEEKFENAYSKGLIDQDAQKYWEREGVADKMVLTKTEVDGEHMYKITLFLDKQSINELTKSLEKDFQEENPSNPDIIPSQEQYELSSGSLEIYIDENYYTRKITISTEIKPNESAEKNPASSILPSLMESSIKFTVVLKFDDYGKDIAISPPESSISFEEFLTTITSLLPTASESAVPSE